MEAHIFSDKKKKMKFGRKIKSALNIALLWTRSHAERNKTK